MTSRQPKGIPVGGQFATSAHSESDVALAPYTFTEYTAPIVGELKLTLGSFEALPEWPEGMPEPSVFFDFDDGKVNTYVDVEGQDYSMRFWTDEIDGTRDSTDHNDNPWSGFDEADQDAARAWGKEVHQRVDSSTYNAMMEATTRGKARETILAYATGKPPVAPSAESSLEQLDERAGQKYMAAQKALKDHDRLTMALLSGRILTDFPTATEVRVKQKIDSGGSLYGHQMTAVRDAQGTNLTEGNDDWNWRPTPDKGRWIGDAFRDIRKDFFEDKHPEMGFGFFDYDQEAGEIIVPLDRDYTEGIED